MCIIYIYTRTNRSETWPSMTIFPDVESGGPIVVDILLLPCSHSINITFSIAIVIIATCKLHGSSTLVAVAAEVAVRPVRNVFAKGCRRKGRGRRHTKEGGPLAHLPNRHSETEKAW